MTVRTPREYPDPSALSHRLGEELGVSAWVEIDQERIQRFADVTEDQQWLHVDPIRARSGRFGATIAHGYLTLALLPALTAGAFRVGAVRSRINYGLERVRFPAIVPAGARVRLRATLISCEPMQHGMRIVVRNVVEVEGRDRPACVADTITLLLTEEDA